MVIYAIRCDRGQQPTNVDGNIQPESAAITAQLAVSALAMSCKWIHCSDKIALIMCKALPSESIIHHEGNLL